MSNLIIASCTTLGVLVATIITKHKRHPYVYVLVFFIALFGTYIIDALYAETRQEITTEFPFTQRLLEHSNLRADGKWEEDENGHYNYRRDKMKDDPTIIVQGKKANQKSNMEDFIKTAQQRIDYHFNEGMRCFKEAEEICLWLPNYDDQEKAKLCFANILAMAVPGSGNVKLLSALVFSISNYGPKVMDQWHMLNAKLLESKHHFEMQEFYSDIGGYLERELKYKIELSKEKRHN